MYTVAPDGICIRRCFGPDGNISLPDEIGARPVTELGAYAFSSRGRGAAVLEGLKEPLFSWDGESEEEWDGDLREAVCDEALLSLRLPAYLKKVGAYAFYGCSALEELNLPGSVSDWGAGVFTGCTSLTRLKLRRGTDSKSCLKEVLFELRQTLSAEFTDLGAKVIFPEFYEDSVENTPARIIMRQMHGCGHMYRYCFEEGRFKFREYDRLFSYMKAEENAPLAARMALCRLSSPWELEREAGEAYAAYLREHPEETALVLLQDEEEALDWMLQSPVLDRPLWEALSALAQKKGRREVVAQLMEVFYRRFGREASLHSKRSGSRRFEL